MNEVKNNILESMSEEDLKKFIMALIRVNGTLNKIKQKRKKNNLDEKTGNDIGNYICRCVCDKES